MVYLSQIPTEPLNRYRAVKREKKKGRKREKIQNISLVRFIACRPIIKNSLFSLYSRSQEFDRRIGTKLGRRETLKLYSPASYRFLNGLKITSDDERPPR